MTKKAVFLMGLAPLARAHPPEDVVFPPRSTALPRCTKRDGAARALQYESINADLIYGLPRQTPLSFARTVQQIGELRPDRIALYAYAHLPERFKPQRVAEDAGDLVLRLLQFLHQFPKDLLELAGQLRQQKLALALRHLVGHGHREIAFIAGSLATGRLLAA